MSSGGLEARVKGRQAVVVLGRIGLVGHADGESGGGMDGGEGGDGHDRYKDGDRLNRWEDTVANVTLGTEPNSHLASAPGLELR